MPTPPEVTGRRFITTNQLRERWGGVSHMFIVRRIEADPAMPRPTKLGGRINFFDLAQIEAYERKRVRASAA